MKYVLVKKLYSVDSYLSYGPYEDISVPEAIKKLQDGYEVYELGGKVEVELTPAKVEIK